MTTEQEKRQIHQIVGLLHGRIESGAALRDAFKWAEEELEMVWKGQFPHEETEEGIEEPPPAPINPPESFIESAVTKAISSNQLIAVMWYHDRFYQVPTASMTNTIFAAANGAERWIAMPDGRFIRLDAELVQSHH